MAPLIGLTPSISDNKKLLNMNRDYMDAVQRSGALPVVLPATDDESVLSAIYDRLDGIVFTGGADLVPALYGQETLPVCGSTEPIRDALEMYLMKRCLKDGKPLLAICRGFEVLNVALGGTLYQVVATIDQEEIGHGLNVVKQYAL